MRSMAGDRNDVTDGQFYAIPELPDALGFYKYDDNGNSSSHFVQGQTLVTAPACNYGWDAQFAEDGTIAIRSRDGNGLLIYRAGEKIGEIPSPVEYFYLSGSGRRSSMDLPKKARISGILPVVKVPWFQINTAPGAFLTMEAL